ncbi:YjbF family lipoprotein [Salipiger sp.]|uniref:YjbF family lipoprotein n=1 Tax=Salipiger sp. TaxID=2078585 RepID=UPI003A96958E
MGTILAMNLRTTFSRIGLFALASALIGCSNDPYFEFPVQSVVPGSLRQDEPSGEITPQAIVEILSATDLPVAFFGVPDRGSQALMIRIEKNGPYETFANPERQSITMRHGMITGTRGLSGDLMSTEEEALLALVRARRAGQVTYVQRYLTPESVTKVVTYRCGVEPDATVDIAIGLVQDSATEMVAACESPDGPPFVDYYKVSGSGEILASRQWLGKNLGYVAMQMLQR